MKKFSTIFFLGIASGLPLALILSTLKALLVDKGFDLKTIGFISLVSLPYSLKIFFAPAIDSFSIPFLTKKFGQRKSWIIFSQILLVIFISALGISGEIPNIGAIAVFSLLIAFASSTQDIVIDGYRIELIKKEAQALAASFYVYGYRIGLLISGAGALALGEFIGWQSIYFIMAAIMIAAIILTFFIDETRKDYQQKKYNFSTWFKESIVAPLLDLSKHKHWYFIIVFIILFKLGDAFAGNLTLPFLLELGFTKIELAKILKTFGLFATLFGVFVGGVLFKKLGAIKSLWLAGIAQMLSNLAFSYLANIGNNSEILYAVVFIENFSGGIGDSVFVAYLSGLCSISFSATQYAILASLATVARSFLAASAGIFATTLGWYNFFIFSTFLALPGLILLFLINRKNH
jgi:PAT family beta-lactamase induction signal transducer AmpG